MTNVWLVLIIGLIASDLTLAYFGIHMSSWSTQWLQGAQVLWLQNKKREIITSPHTEIIQQLIWGDFADMLFGFLQNFGLVCPKDNVPEILMYIYGYIDFFLLIL